MIKLNSKKHLAMAVPVPTKPNKNFDPVKIFTTTGSNKNSILEAVGIDENDDRELTSDEKDQVLIECMKSILECIIALNE